MTAMRDALNRAGVDTEAVRLRAVVLANKNDPLALWHRLATDKAVALVAMQQLIKLIAGVEPPTQPSYTAQSSTANLDEMRVKRAASRQAVQAQAQKIADRIRALYTDRLQNGRLIHRVQLLEIEDICASNDREAAFLRALKHRVRANDSSVTIGDTISPDNYDALRREFYDQS